MIHKVQLFLSRHLVWRLCPALATGMLLASAVHAQLNSQVLRPYVGVASTYDSNVLGLDSAEVSDTARTATAGVDYVQMLGRQLLTASLAGSRTRFNRLTELDYHGENLAADWAWQVGNHWHGKAGATRSISLAPYTDFHNAESNTNKVDRRYVTANWQYHPDWQLRAELSRYGVAYSLASQAQFDRTERLALIGIDYKTRAGNVLGVQAKTTDGHLPNQLPGPDSRANAYRQNQVDLKATWHLTGITRLDAVIGMVARTHAVAAGRDFHGPNGRATFNVAVTRATTLTVAAWRETGIFDDVSTAYSTNRGASAGLRWIATNKLTVDASGRRESRDFTRSIAFATSPAFRDVLQTGQLGLTYVPFARVNLQFAIFNASKKNSGASGEYARHGASFNSRYEF
jgi:hypothetical protein